jgi:hypothetical protein
MITTPFREPARLLFHLNGVSRIVVERYEGLGIADGGFWDIPTGLIPLELRSLGARFLIVGQYVWPEAGDSGEELRDAVRSLRVEPIEGER